MKLNRILGLLYLMLLVSLFVYSFTQVDLSLTLSQNSIYQAIEKGLQYIGFFLRPLSASIFAIIAALFFIFYLIFLYLAKENRFSFFNLKILSVLTFIVLVFSYNAFSYDLFNYIFDAKIFTFYHLNPYYFKPIDFVSDPMLSFMRWTHRTFPYGPSWLALTIPLSYLGINIFLLTFFIFKFMVGLAYLGSVYLIYKISEIIFPKDKIFNTIFFAFNPLVIIEGLVSAHNDFPLVFFALLAIYLFLIKKRFLSGLSLVFSIGIKYLSFVLIPVFGYLFYVEKVGTKIKWEKIFIFSLAFSIISLFAVTYRTTFQPWYLIFPLSLASFVSKKSFVFFPALVSSITCALIYIVYVLYTDYSPNYPSIILAIEWFGLISTILSFFVVILRYRISK